MFISRYRTDKTGISPTSIPVRQNYNWFLLEQVYKCLYLLTIFNYNLISKTIVHVADYQTLIDNCDIVLLQIKNSSSCALMRLIIKLKIQDQVASSFL